MGANQTREVGRTVQDCENSESVHNMEGIARRANQESSPLITSSGRAKPMESGPADIELHSKRISCASSSEGETPTTVPTDDAMSLLEDDALPDEAGGDEDLAASTSPAEDVLNDLRRSIGELDDQIQSMGRCSRFCSSSEHLALIVQRDQALSNLSAARAQRREALQEEIRQVDEQLAPKVWAWWTTGDASLDLKRRREDLVSELADLEQDEASDLRRRIERLDDELQAMPFMSHLWTCRGSDLEQEREKLQGELQTLTGEVARKDRAAYSKGACRYLAEVSPGSPAWDEVVNLVNLRSQPWRRHYNFSIHVRKLWKVQDNQLLRRYETRAAKLGKPTQLFHGTAVEYAARIVRGGFQVPRRHSHGGMFGRGIYFAECPLKSVNYTQREGIISRIHRWITGETSCDGGLQMLLCDVYLGRSRTLRAGRSKFNPAQDLESGWVFKSLGFSDYSSVYAPGGFLGAVNVAEYVVYKPFQAVPKYLIEFDVRYGKSSAS